MHTIAFPKMADYDVPARYLLNHITNCKIIKPDINLNTIGGHLKDNCLVNVTAEIVLAEFDEYEFSREFDESTGYKELVIKERQNNVRG